MSYFDPNVENVKKNKKEQLKKFINVKNNNGSAKTENLKDVDRNEDKKGNIEDMKVEKNH